MWFAILAYPGRFPECAQILVNVPTLFDAVVVEAASYAVLVSLAGLICFYRTWSTYHAAARKER